MRQDEAGAYGRADQSDDRADQNAGVLQIWFVEESRGQEYDWGLACCRLPFHMHAIACALSCTMRRAADKAAIPGHATAR